MLFIAKIETFAFENLKVEIDSKRCDLSFSKLSLLALHDNDIITNDNKIL